MLEPSGLVCLKQVRASCARVECVHVWIGELESCVCVCAACISVERIAMRKAAKHTHTHPFQHL